MADKTTMTSEMIENAVLRLIPDALALVERTLREQAKPSKAALDAAWRCIGAGLEQDPAADLEPVPVGESQLATVLELVGR